jgi:hypothetical protein
VDRQNNHLLGLMVPDVDADAHENCVHAEPPLELHPEQMIQFDAEILLCEGTALDVLVDWVLRPRAAGEGASIPPNFRPLW